MGERIRLTEKNIEDAAQKAAEVLRRGGVVLYPTDTLYGLGVDALRQDALAKLFAIKGRDEGKPVHSIFSGIEAARGYAEITPLARDLAGRFLPGALTLLLQKKDTVPGWAVAGRETIGVRVPDSAFCLALAAAFGRPYTSSSANRSKEAALADVDAIVRQLGDHAAMIDLIIDAGELPSRTPSTIVDARGDTPIIEREGAIASAEVIS